MCNVSGSIESYGKAMSLCGEMMEVSCDLCGCAEHDLLFEKEGFRHVRCTACSMVYVNPRLKEHVRLQEESGTGSMGDDQLTTGARRRLRKELRSLEAFRKRNRILEVGAGRGWFIGEAAAAGWEAWAVEINRDAVRRLEQRGIALIITEPAETFDAPSDSVDVVRLWDVVEHLESPRSALANVFRVLRPGGMIRLATTNFASLSRMVNGPEWVYLNGADHIHLFEPHTIALLLTRIGFHEVRIRTRSFNLRRKLYFPERKLPPPKTILRPFRPVIDEAIRFTKYGHQMIATAIKPEVGPGDRSP